MLRKNNEINKCTCGCKDHSKCTCHVNTINDNNINKDGKYDKLTCQTLLDIQMPNYTTQEMLFRNENDICPKYNGSYAQCTNNNMPMLPAGACQYYSRIFETCPPPYRVSEKELYKYTGDPVKDVPTAPVHYPNPNNHSNPLINNVRINMWRTPDKAPCEWLVQCGKGVKHSFWAEKSLFIEPTTKDQRNIMKKFT